MKITKNARAVLERRYLTRDTHGQLTETVEGLFRRVADAIAAADLNYNSAADVLTTADRFYNMMTELDFLPNSPTLMNAGRPLGQLSACFVLPIPDSMEAIFDGVKNAALIHKSGGGTGFSFSRLRMQGASVNSTGGVASGPVSFMKVFNAATEAVKQGGTRRGANMGILRVDHPDIMSFITCKNDKNELTNFNISVGITEAFMKAVESGSPYNLIDPGTQEITGQLDAKEVFDTIVTSAWQTGEPGIIFLDRLNSNNVVPGQGEIEATNPCGEQPLLPYESCNLGSINLVNHLKLENGCYVLDTDKLAKTIHDAVHFLDNVIDANVYPLDEIERVTKLTRKIGLGVMGFADMLLKLGIPYNSHEGVALGGRIMEMVNTIGHEASMELAEIRGAFPLFEESIFKEGKPLRNATVTTIAPNGTLSIIAGVSSGIEPVFAYAYIRNVMDNTHLIEINETLKARLTDENLYSDQIMEEVAEHGTLADSSALPEALKKVFVCAHDVSPSWHVKMQAEFQKHTDNAVSKTVNFSNTATKQDVAEVYQLAYSLGCKGTTIYRDGSRDGQVLNIGKVNDKDHTKENLCESCTVKQGIITPRTRPDITSGFTEKVKIGCGNLYITVNYDENGICEVFTNTGRTGGCPSQSEATARLVSIALRSGISSEALVEQLKGIRCPSTIRQKGMNVTSCPDAIAKAIEKGVKSSNTCAVALSETPPEATTIPAVSSVEILHARYCPECGSELEHEGGCVTCRNCGYSKCG
ncbi:vitamin B12-dependent ribonucleotide reductase [Aminipila terrae]|uniref:Vitamin B12-dependent ribonucleotide reductase n=1 Tax=Aminipila terrae TaxID=2697030 RepID=A0A6P1MBL1_9FIRM|nr:vitamin B12-dependent ribonucleotide reductase [Aminipila terrae]QHI72020.1 vitamin B12-dependent ribonucleotide reductase [Aminipila terrae]